MSLEVAAKTQDRHVDEERVRALDDQERIATLARDISTMERLRSEELTANAPMERLSSWGLRGPVARTMSEREPGLALLPTAGQSLKTQYIVPRGGWPGPRPEAR